MAQTPQTAFSHEDTDRVLTLRGEAAMKIFINPTRMRIFEEMSLHPEPLTPKALADRLGLSPSSAKHHLAKLESIGVVQLDHQAKIHGIVASYYRLTDRMVSLDAADPAAREFAAIAMRTSAARVQRGLLDSLARWQDAGAREEERWGMLDTDGVLHLTPEEARALEAAIHAFAAAHSAPRPGTAPIRYNLMAYRADGAPDMPAPQPGAGPEGGDRDVEP